jgi:hypothetical protein
MSNRLARSRGAEPFDSTYELLDMSREMQFHMVVHNPCEHALTWFLRIIRHHTLHCDVYHTFIFYPFRQDTSIVIVNVQKGSVIPGSKQLEYLKKNYVGFQSHQPRVHGQSRHCLTFGLVLLWMILRHWMRLVDFECIFRSMPVYKTWDLLRYEKVMLFLQRNGP